MGRSGVGVAENRLGIFFGQKEVAMPRRRTTSRQLDLLQNVDPDELWWRCEGIFTPNYLKRRALRVAICPTRGRCAELYREVKSRWVNNYAGLRRRKEAYTAHMFPRSNSIRPRVVLHSRERPAARKHAQTA